MSDLANAIIKLANPHHRNDTLTSGEAYQVALNIAAVLVSAYNCDSIAAPAEVAARLSNRQVAEYKSLLKLADDYGLWTTGNGSDGASYTENNPGHLVGSSCANCAFYKGDWCDIVAVQPAPWGVCRLGVMFVDGNRLDSCDCGCPKCKKKQKTKVEKDESDASEDEVRDDSQRRRDLPQTSIGIASNPDDQPFAERYRQSVNAEFNKYPEDAQAKVSTVLQQVSEKANLAGLTPTEGWAIREYCSTKYRKINQTLRGDTLLLQTDVDQVNTVLSGMRKLPPVPANSITSRYVDLPNNVIDKYEFGAELTEFAFTSTTASADLPARSGQFRGKNTIFRIKAAVDSKGRSVKPVATYDWEEEVLYPPGTRFRCTNKVKNGETWEIELEELP